MSEDKIEWRNKGMANLSLACRELRERWKTEFDPNCIVAMNRGKECNDLFI